MQRSPCFEVAMPINAADYILPLVVGKKDSSNVSAGINRFAGTGFFIGVGGLVATCSHIMAPQKTMKC